MKIIKHGNRSGKDSTIQFICKVCDCVFEADSRDEVSKARDIKDGKLSFMARCPECHFAVTVDAE